MKFLRKFGNNKWICAVIATFVGILDRRFFDRLFSQQKPIQLSTLNERRQSEKGRCTHSERVRKITNEKYKYFTGGNRL